MCELSFNDYVFEDFDQFIEYDKINEYYLKSNKCLYTYNDLINDTINEIKI